MTYETTIALRYLKSRRLGLFHFVTTLIAVGGVTLGVAALIVTLAVMNGFRADIQSKTLGIQPHIVLLGTEKDDDLQIEALADKIRSLPQVRSVAPYVLGQILLKSGRNAQGIVLKGIQPDREFTVTAVKNTLVSGSWDGLTEEGGPKGIVLGHELARALGLSTGDEVLALSPTETASLGAMASVPKVEKFVVQGIFQSGFYEYDANLAFVSLPVAREFYGMTGVTGLGIKTNNLDDADRIAGKVQQAAGPQYWARSWQAMNRNLFSALKLEKGVMMLILTMIILVACFTIISNLILMSIEKSRDIGILRALGATRASIRKIFLYAGMILGCFGIALGLALGLGIVAAFSKYQWIKLPQDVYYIDRLPFKIDWGDMTIVLVAAFVITALAAIYPASRASKVNPVEAIRYG